MFCPKWDESFFYVEYWSMTNAKTLLTIFQRRKSISRAKYLNIILHCLMFVTSAQPQITLWLWLSNFPPKWHMWGEGNLTYWNMTWNTLRGSLDHFGNNLLLWFMVVGEEWISKQRSSFFVYCRPLINLLSHLYDMRLFKQL